MFCKGVMFPIKGREVGPKDYNQEKKHKDENKKLYHAGLVTHVNDLINYNTLCGSETPIDVITLESKDAASAKIMVQQCGIRLDHIDLVSKNVEFFTTKRNVKTGDLYNGELFNYLNNIRPQVYDVANFDFSGTWATQKKCVKRVFEDHLMDECSLLAITCSLRGNPGSHSLYQRQDEQQCIHDVKMWAWANGYDAHVAHRPFHYDTMFVVFFKVIHLEFTMNYKDGIDCSITAQEWMRTPIDIEVPTPAKKTPYPKIVPKVGKKKRL